MRHRVQLPFVSNHFDDEGVGDDEDEWPSMDVDSEHNTVAMETRFPETPQPSPSFPSPSHFEGHPSTFIANSSQPKVDYKLLHQTHTLLRNRLLHSSYHLTYLQTKGSPDSHTALIYCLHLHTFPDTPDTPRRQVLFTGSRDRTIRQWDLSKGIFEKVYQDVHEGSILSICVQGNYLISGGSDRKVVVWDIETGRVVRAIEDHMDSVLCVRSDNTRLVTCSKGSLLCGISL